CVLAGESQSEIVPGDPRAGVELQRFPKFLRSLVVLLLHQEVVAEIVVKRILGWIQLEGFAVPGFAFAPLPGLIAKDARPGGEVRRLLGMRGEEGLQAVD